ncbi:phosphonate C-P lyase system protein PhnL [Vibrio nomapromontoriensis]|uniref:phosphonate C-P lyase system protein PhnL n=1 Tax=Vibrio nomapromontoriensis TaxID=2910246 RepID=UPI003D0D4E52
MNVKLAHVRLQVSNVSKTFVLHNQESAELPVLSNACFSVSDGECVVLNGRSGSGKSTLLRALYGNYLVDSGDIEVEHQGRWLNLATATPREILNVRKQTIGWVSQFLRVIPRISALEVVMQPMIEMGGCREQAQAKAQSLLTRLNVPAHLWNLAPATFSGGEQQRVNIARGFIVDYPILLLDEPTASLDATNSAVVVNLIKEAKARGAAVVGIFHDEQTRDEVADRLYDVKKGAPQPTSETALSSMSPSSSISACA